MDKKVKLIIMLTVLIDVVGIGIVIPILPFYIQNFDASPTVLTSLFAVFSLFSFLSSPLLGSLSDKIGRRPVLIISLFSTAIGWLVFAAANNVFLLFLGRIIDGLAAGNFSTAQSCFVDIAKDEKERTSNLGIIGAIFGVGFVLGPIAGGLLSSISITAPFWFVGVLALINTILAFFILPETNRHKRVDLKINFNPISPLVKALKNKKILPLYVIWGLFGLAVSSIQSVISLYFSVVFGMTAFTISLLLSLQGVVMALNQGVGLKHFWLKHFRQSELAFWTLLGYSIGFFMMGLDWKIFFIIGFVLSVLIQPVLRVSFTSQAVGAVDAKERGETLGVMTSVASLGMVFGPLMVGPLFELKHGLPFYFSAFYLLVGFVIAYHYRRWLAKIKAVEDVRTDVV